jgi:hypothetical protein
MKDNLKLIEPPSGHQVVKTHVLIFPGVLKQISIILKIFT